MNYTIGRVKPLDKRTFCCLYGVKDFNEALEVINDHKKLYGKRYKFFEISDLEKSDYLELTIYISND